MTGTGFRWVQDFSGVLALLFIAAVSTIGFGLGPTHADTLLVQAGGPGLDRRIIEVLGTGVPWGRITNASDMPSGTTVHILYGGGSRNAANYPFDPNTARMRLAEMDHPDGLRLVLHYRFDLNRAANLVRDYLEKLGNSVSLQLQPPNEAGPGPPAIQSTGPYVLLWPGPLPGRVDLEIRNVAVEFDSERGEIKVSAEVRNLGDDPSQPTTVRLNHNAGAGSTDVDLPALRPEETERVNLRLDLPQDLWGRNHRLNVEVDPDGNTSDYNRQNNDATVLRRSPPRGPDLEVTARSTDHPEERSRLTLEATVSNVGNVNAPRSVVSVRLEDSTSDEVVTSQVSRLAPGESEVVELLLRVPERLLGRKALVVVVVEPETQIDEPTRENNVWKSEVRIPDQRPDLKIVDTRSRLENDGRTLIIDADIRNDGPGPASRVEVRVVEQRVVGFEGNATINRLPPEQTDTAEVRLTVPEIALGSQRTFDVIVDPADAISERNENNNAITLTRHIDPLEPDLRVSIGEITFDWDLEVAKLRVHVSNVGRNDARGVILRVSDISPAGASTERSLGRINAGTENQIVTIPMDVRAPREAMQLAYEAWIDPEDAVAEVSERNNRDRREFTIPAPPLPWGLIIGIGIVVLAGSGLWLLRKRLDGGRDDLSKPRPKPAPKLSVEPHTDPGEQFVTRAPHDVWHPTIWICAVADRGAQTINPSG